MCLRVALHSLGWTFSALCTAAPRSSAFSCAAHCTGRALRAVYACIASLLRSATHWPQLGSYHARFAHFACFDLLPNWFLSGPSSTSPSSTSPRTWALHSLPCLSAFAVCKLSYSAQHVLPAALLLQLLSCFSQCTALLSFALPRNGNKHGPQSLHAGSP